MAEENKELTKELKKLNNNLEELKTSGKYLIYSANPLKFGLFNFIAGIFHVLGTLFGYIVIFGAIVYFLSQNNLTKIISRWLENTLQQVRWERIIVPQTNTNQQLQNISPEQIENIQQQLNVENMN
jgi:predicted PurR-regulated permease PerM